MTKKEQADLQRRIRMIEMNSILQGNGIDIVYYQGKEGTYVLPDWDYDLVGFEFDKN